jgi:hypothetical protein
MLEYSKSGMTNTRKFNSVGFEAIHSSVLGMYRAGTIDEASLRIFEESCLAAVPAIQAGQPNDLCPLPENERVQGREADCGAQRRGAQTSERYEETQPEHAPTKPEE